MTSGQCLKCYHDKESSKVTKCDENLGYRTCFIRYDESKYDVINYIFIFWLKIFLFFEIKVSWLIIFSNNLIKSLEYINLTYQLNLKNYKFFKLLSAKKI